MEKNELRRSIIDRIQGAPRGLSRFLQTTGSAIWPNEDLGIVGLEDFLSYLYQEAALARDKKYKICENISVKGRNNTFFILGYPGCGKTTFIQALLDKCKKDNLTEQILMIHCDRYGTSSDTSSLIASFQAQTMRYLDKQEKLTNLINFYTKNRTIFKNNFGNVGKLDELIKKITAFNSEGKNIGDNDANMYFRGEILNSLEFRELFYFFCFLLISSRYGREVSEKPILMVIDNLDYFDDFNDLNRFMKAVNDFTLEMCQSMNLMELYYNCDKRFLYKDKFKLVIAMRESTKANIPMAHWARGDISTHEYNDISKWYDKAEIIEHKLNFLKADEIDELKDKIHFMRLIIQDTKSRGKKDFIFPLYNNDYRIAVDSLTKVIERHIDCLPEWDTIMKLEKHPHLKYGARGMLVRWLCDEFISAEGYNKENYLAKIGVLDFQERKNVINNKNVKGNEVSVSRLILAYLSNKTETKCDDAKNCVPLIDIFKEFNGIFPAPDIKKSIFEMYDLLYAPSWSHLVSFSQLERENDALSSDLNGMKNINVSLTTLRYSCAGKTYLEFLSSHFEFFAARTFVGNDQYDALFCKSNRIKKGGIYKFIHIINSVYEEVEKCCVALKKFNTNLCLKKNYGDPYTLEKAAGEYLTSDCVGQLKKEEDGIVKKSKFFHGERFLNTHIVYIDMFRLYVLNYCEDIPKEEKFEINKQLVNLVKKYVELLSSSDVLKDVNGRIYGELLSHYKKQIAWIENTEYRGFSIKINMQDD